MKMDSHVLFISPNSNDAETISRILEAAFVDCEHAANYREARSRLAGNAYGAILTEADLPDGSWKDIIRLALDLPAQPAVVVTRPAADDRFWGDVLNLGCYDLLTQPFDTREVQRILSLACEQSSVKLTAAASPARTLFVAR
jgi:DNA-binding NtrC family response regulator